MRREKGTKTGAELNIPVHPVLQCMLEEWEARGWKEFMDRKPGPDDLIVPRTDGTQRLVSTSYKQFKLDLAAVGIDFQRQYESRATFRNLALSAGVAKYQVDLITHPKPTQGPDFYNRLDMLWPDSARRSPPSTRAPGTALQLHPQRGLQIGLHSGLQVKGRGKKKPRQH